MGNSSHLTVHSGKIEVERLAGVTRATYNTQLMVILTTVSESWLVAYFQYVFKFKILVVSVHVKYWWKIPYSCLYALLIWLKNEMLLAPTYYECGYHAWKYSHQPVATYFCLLASDVNTQQNNKVRDQRAIYRVVEEMEMMTNMTSIYYPWRFLNSLIYHSFMV